MCTDIECIENENEEAIKELKAVLAMQHSRVVAVSEQNAYYANRIEELETQLQQYKAFVADLTVTINKNICKDFSPNIGG